MLHRVGFFFLTGQFLSRVMNMIGRMDPSTASVTFEKQPTAPPPAYSATNSKIHVSNPSMLTGNDNGFLSSGLPPPQQAYQLPIHQHPQYGRKWVWGSVRLTIWLYEQCFANWSTWRCRTCRASDAPRWFFVDLYYFSNSLFWTIQDLQVQVGYLIK